MRIAVLILGLLLGLLMFFQTFLVYALSGATDDPRSGEAGAIGILMAVIWLLACALVIPLPFISMLLFIAAGALGFSMSGDFADLGVWGGVSLFLAILSFFGWIGKRKADRRERRRDEWMQETASQSGQRPPA